MRMQSALLLCLIAPALAAPRSLRADEPVQERKPEAQAAQQQEVEPPPPLPTGESGDKGRDFGEVTPIEGPNGTLVCPEGSKPKLAADGSETKSADGGPLCLPVRKFIKGELTNLGSQKLVVKDSRFGIRVGAAYLDHTAYLAISPEIDLRFDKLAIGIGVPLHIDGLQLYDGNGVHFRKHDYDSASDYAKIVRFITYGAKEENLYFNVTQLFAATIGHGALVRRYSGNTDENITRVGVELDAYGKYGGFEAFVGDVVQPSHFISGLLFLKPLGFANLKGPAADTWGQTSLGVSMAADFNAPFLLARDAAGRPQTDDKGEPVVNTTQSAVFGGIDVETKLVKSERVDIKPYVDYSRLFSSATMQDGRQASGGGGFTAGMLGRFNVGGEKVHAFRVVLEGRFFDANFLPGYFDTFYEVQKYQNITGAASTNYDPKLYTLLAQDPSSKRAGFYVEAAWQYNGGFAIMASYEDATSPNAALTPSTSDPTVLPQVGGRNLTLHIEYPVYSFLQFFGSFYRRSYSGSPFPSQDKNGNYPSDMLIYAAARLHVLPILFINGRYYRTWQADPALGQMRNVNGFELDLELGYEFDRSSRKR
jgi:hypothetical protein